MAKPDECNADPPTCEVAPDPAASPPYKCFANCAGNNAKYYPSAVDATGLFWDHSVDDRGQLAPNNLNSFRYFYSFGHWPDDEAHLSGKPKGYLDRQHFGISLSDGRMVVKRPFRGAWVRTGIGAHLQPGQWNVVRVKVTFATNQPHVGEGDFDNTANGKIDVYVNCQKVDPNSGSAFEVGGQHVVTRLTAAEIASCEEDDSVATDGDTCGPTIGAQSTKYLRGNSAHKRFYLGDLAEYVIYDGLLSDYEASEACNAIGGQLRCAAARAARTAGRARRRRRRRR